MKKVMLILMLVGVGCIFMLNLAVERGWVAVKGTTVYAAEINQEIDPNEWAVWASTATDPNIWLVTEDYAVSHYDISITVGDGEILFTTTDDGKMDIIFDANDCTANVVAFVDCMETMMPGYILSMAKKLTGVKE